MHPSSGNENIKSPSRGLPRHPLRQEGGGVYVHVPFCTSKCIYCDFFSGGMHPDWNLFVDSLLAELHSRSSEIPFPVRTIYIGGGTPSLIPPEPFGRLAGGIMEAIGAQGAIAENGIEEFTIEVNPDDVSAQMVAAWQRGGVNRVSMGVQSLIDSELQFLRRRHSAEAVRLAAGMIRDAFPQMSLDLIFGIPGQTLDSLEESVRGLMKLDPGHISVYSLMYEEGTPLTVLRDSGRIRELDEELSLAMFDLVDSLLCADGFERYEISNFARPGCRSLHNSSYWNHQPYIGIGPAAASFDGCSCRRTNGRNIHSYLAGADPEFVEEHLSIEELREERIFTQLRTRSGIDLELFQLDFGSGALRSLLSSASASLRNGLLRHDGSHLALTREGIMTSDSIILQLL